MRAMSGLGWGVVLLAGAMVAAAQETAKKAEPTTGVVTGQVSCADTNAPARFAVVTLEPVPGDKADAKDKKKHDSGMNATATTDLEGRFELDKVGVGRYYVIGSLSGYLNPLAGFDEKQLHDVTEETRKELGKVLPVVDVEAGQAATVTLRLERAAEVSGDVLYDDGSPAVGLKLHLLRKDKDGKLIEVSPMMLDRTGIFGAHETTDDRGRYRMIGVPAGEYAVSATLPAEEMTMGGLLGSGGASMTMTSNEGGAFSVFYGGKFRKKDAATIKVGEGELVGGIDVTIPIGGLHTIRGTVTAQRDGHPLSIADLELLYADDMESARSVRMEGDDGSFVLAYVPEGKYILRVLSASDAEKLEIHEGTVSLSQNIVIRYYGKAEMPLLVQGDVSGFDLAAPDVAADKAAQ